MGRKIVLDSSVINEINRGNQDVARTLLELKRAGHDISITQQGYNELTTGGTPADHAAAKETLRELNIPVAPAGSPQRRADFYQWNTVDKPGGQAKIQDGARWGPPTDPTDPN